MKKDTITIIELITVTLILCPVAICIGLALTPLFRLIE
jgi:hypothetical protein